MTIENTGREMFRVFLLLLQDILKSVPVLSIGFIGLCLPLGCCCFHVCGRLRLKCF